MAWVNSLNCYLFLLIFTILSSNFNPIRAENHTQSRPSNPALPQNTTEEVNNATTKAVPKEDEKSVFSEHKWEFILLIAILLVIVLAAILQLTNYRMLKQSGETDFCLRPRLPRLLKNKSAPTDPPCVPISDRDLIPVVEL